MRPDRAVVKKAIHDSGGNLSRAVALLGCSRQTLYTWIYQLGLERIAGICQDRRIELDRRECKDTRVGKEIVPGVKSRRDELPNLHLVPQQAVVEMPVNATVKLPESLWKRVRIRAIDQGCTVSEFVQAALESALVDGAERPQRPARGRKESGE